MFLTLYFLPDGYSMARTKAGTLNPKVDYPPLGFCRERDKHLLCVSQCMLGTVCYRSLGGALSSTVASLIDAKFLEGNIISKKQS